MIAISCTILSLRARCAYVSHFGWAFIEVLKQIKRWRYINNLNSAANGENHSTRKIKSIQNGLWAQLADLREQIGLITGAGMGLVPTYGII